MQRRSQQQPLGPRLARAVLVLAGALVLAAPLAMVAIGATPAPAGADATTGTAPADSGELEPCPADLGSIAASDTEVHVAKVSGLIDPIVRSYLLEEIDRAERQGALALVLWLDSNGSVLDDDDYLSLATALAESTTQIVIWVGQSGAVARGGAAELLGVADLVGVSAGSRIGDTGPARLPATFPPAFGDATDRLETTTISADEAVQLGISPGPLSDVSTIGSFLTLIPGYEVERCLDADAVAGGDGGDPSGGIRTISTTQNLLSGLPLVSQLFHTVASPEVAYLLFALGLALLVFELYTAGIGVAGVIGAGLLALGCYGLAVLPTRWWAIALIIVAMLMLTVDIQTNVPRYYTVGGLIAFVIGTFTLYDGVSMSWVTIIAGIVGAVLYAYGGMPSMVRTRFSTPTIGRKWMIGEMGEAVTDVSPEGVVRIRDVSWRATTNRATPVKAGEPVRVVGLERLVLEIEPEEGGAKDYRQRR